MTYVLIRHKIANYAKWKKYVQDFKKFRKASGEKSFHVLRGAKNSNDVIVCCAWDTTAKLKKFLKSTELRKGMKEAGVISKPEISFWGKSDDLSV